MPYSMRSNTHTYEQTARSPPVPPGTTPTPNLSRPGPPPGFAPQKPLPARLPPHYQGGPKNRHQIRPQGSGAPSPRHDGQSPQGAQTPPASLREQLAPAPTATLGLKHARVQGLACGL